MLLYTKAVRRNNQATTVLTRCAGHCMPYGDTDFPPASIKCFCVGRDSVPLACAIRQKFSVCFPLFKYFNETCNLFAAVFLFFHRHDVMESISAPILCDEKIS
jgi:hypothetical protein